MLTFVIDTRGADEHEYVLGDRSFASKEANFLYIYMMRINIYPHRILTRFLIATITLGLFALPAFSAPLNAISSDYYQRDKSAKNKQDDKKREVKEVPKSRRQSKPEPVKQEKKEKEKPSRSRDKKG